MAWIGSITIVSFKRQNTRTRYDIHSVIGLFALVSCRSIPIHKHTLDLLELTRFPADTMYIVLKCETTDTHTIMIAQHQFEWVCEQMNSIVTYQPYPNEIWRKRECVQAPEYKAKPANSSNSSRYGPTCAIVLVCTLCVCMRRLFGTFMNFVFFRFNMAKAVFDVGCVWFIALRFSCN